MPKSFKNYYPGSLRLSKWNYSWQGHYFITICTKTKVPYFGEIRNGIMGLNELGIIVCEEWERGVEIRPDMNINLGPFIVMPDHFHAIISIGENQYNIRSGSKIQEGGIPEAGDGQNNFGPQRKNLSAVVRGFKGAVTRASREYSESFAWQSGFYDRIIRNSKGYQQVALYIINNPLKWP